MKQSPSNMSINQWVYVILFFLVSVVTPIYSEERPGLSMQSDVVEKHDETPVSEFKRIKETGGAVLIDGSMRVLEPIYLKEVDLVEISSSITPAANHVRLYAVAVGTYTVLKAQFDNGTIVTITNN